MNTALITFCDIFDGGCFAQWEGGTYCFIPVVGDFVHVRMDDGGEQIWKVKYRCIERGTVNLYCKFHKQCIEPKIK